MFSVLFDDNLSMSEFFNFRTGGMSIIGAVVGGGLALLVFCLIKDRKNMLLHFDVLAVVLILAQAVGRWGNYFNSEVYGRVVSPDSLYAVFPFVVKINGTLYQALFFYEFVLNMISFIILTLMFLKEKKHGYVTAWYLILYGTIRTCLEPLRQPQYILTYLSFPISRIFSIGMIVLGVLLYVSLFIQSKKKKGEVNGKKAKSR